MSNSSSSSSHGGIGFFGFVGLLTLAFIALKLVLDWPWRWALSPFWIGAVVAIVCIGTILAMTDR